MDKCNVCGAHIFPGSGVFIPELIKGVNVYGCQNCKNSVVRSELLRQIKAVKDKHKHINWFRYKYGNQFKEGHSFIFQNGDVISIYHEQGDCSLEDLLTYVNSPKFSFDIFVDWKNREKYYAEQGVVYPKDPFNAVGWW